MRGNWTRRLGRGRALRLALLMVALASALAAPGAQAATVTVGSPLTASFSHLFGQIGSQATIFNSALPEPGAHLSSPISGTIVRWRISGPVGGPFRLRVLRPAGGGQYTGAGTGPPQMPSGTGVQTLPAGLPIQAGDIIAVDNTNISDNYDFANVTGASFSFFNSPPLADGSTRAPNTTVTGQEAGFNADVQPAPGITSLSPSSGSISGATPVTITGHEFTGATAVSFGGVAAASFTINSDTQITGISPPSSTPGAVDVRVTALGGQTTPGAADKFTYTACVVPKLKGSKLKKANQALQQANCTLGKVTKKKHKKGKKQKARKVKSQSPALGTVLPPGSKVSIKLS